MAYTDKDAIYEIAEKLGYQGDEGLTTTEAVYAVAAALGYTGEHDKSVALALSDLKTVVGGGGGDLGEGVGIFVKKTGVGADLGFMVGDASGAHLTVQTVVDTPVFVPSGIEYILVDPNDGTNHYEFSDGNVSAIVDTNGTKAAFTDFAVVDLTMGGQTTKAVKFTPPAPSEGAEVAYEFTIAT